MEWYRRRAPLAATGPRRLRASGAGSPERRVANRGRVPMFLSFGFVFLSLFFLLWPAGRHVKGPWRSPSRRLLLGLGPHPASPRSLVHEHRRPAACGMGAAFPSRCTGRIGVAHRCALVIPTGRASRPRRGVRAELLATMWAICVA